MKRITYAGGSIVTGSAVTDALLEFATNVASDSSSVAVDVPVLEEDGTTTIHTLLLGPGMQFDVSDVELLSADEEERLFPVPDLPQIGIVAVSRPSVQADKDAAAFNREVANIENGLSHEQ
ncbi:hypothetical protein [Cryobacterium tagatosivorans]|uniref:Uncharacterized protein n=1 Tax=Cryobacterium tagatosivorans TaxID=1259199 RepID=A0A4R8UD26_9MICO|nr:hypothetical protein [Cryobacterium tagatosivorans]TFB49879.1 hypothetical protein E3O23_10810 [Cryobacterium tagatosivorans]